MNLRRSSCIFGARRQRLTPENPESPASSLIAPDALFPEQANQIEIFQNGGSVREFFRQNGVNDAEGMKYMMPKCRLYHRNL
jgi:hypothetical protein